VGLLCALFTGLAVIAGDLPGVRPSPAGAQGASGNQPAPHGADFAAAQRYVNTFYPRWFTYRQSEKGSASNQLVGPDHISPAYKTVVAINDDTLYVSSFVDRTDEPVVLTIPDPTINNITVTYSLLTLDVYGDIFETGIPNTKGGIYALTAP
jgi:hypothetical protein